MREEVTGPPVPEMAATGIAGLDKLLHGGLPRKHHYLVEGESGSGKTTVGMQFLLEGAARGERVLLITMAEAAADLEVIARSHGWSLAGVAIYEVAPLDTAQQLNSQQTVFPVSEVELGGLTEQLIAVIREKEPQRVVIDSITELRLLSESHLRFRRQIFSLGHLLEEVGATTIFIDRIPGTEGTGTSVMDSLVHGIIRLERHTANYGAAQRRLEVRKLRGMAYRDEWHDFRIEHGGLVVYPQPRGFSAEEYDRWQLLSSGLDTIDQLLGGGLELGSACLLGGASGTGKSTIADLFAHAALRQGMPAGIFVFDERPETLFKRTADLGMPLRPFAATGQLAVRPIETGAISPGEFSHHVRSLVEDKGARVLIFDSLTGYLRMMPDDRLVLNQMHDLLNYLSHRGVLSLLIVTHHGLVGANPTEALDLSYLADTIILLRHFEAYGTLRQAISVVKKRHSQHEKTIREVRIEPGGVKVSAPLQGFRGVLTGVPVYEGRAASLLAQEEE